MKGPKEFELIGLAIQPAVNGFVVSYHGIRHGYCPESIDRTHVAMSAAEALGYAQWALTGRIFKHDQ